jgi:opacity protein-like surface antigen
MTTSKTRRLSLIQCALPFATCLATLCLAALAHAADAPSKESRESKETGTRDEGTDRDESEGRPAYGQKGAVELGGSIGMNWTNDAFALDLSPSVGYFMLDRVELSALLRVTYEDQKNDNGDRESVKSGALIVEPSYHLPVREEVFVLAGLGFGVGHDDEDFDLEFIPRVGLNIGIDLVGVVTPSVKMPILIDNDGTSAGLGLEVGYSVVW